jgi:predicted enzyme related to lactoylglutathione lyase
MHRVIHFEISADNPVRASKFYSDLFGWSFQHWGEGGQDYWLVTTGPSDQPGINGGMFIRKGPVGHVNSVDVEDIDASAKQVVDLGGEIVVQKIAIPGVGYSMYCKDTEGSLFGLYQNDPDAR